MSNYGSVKLDPPLEKTSDYPLLKDAPRNTFGVLMGEDWEEQWTVYVNALGDVVFIEDLDVFTKEAGDRLKLSSFRFRALPAGTKVSANWVANQD